MCLIAIKRLDSYASEAHSKYGSLTSLFISTQMWKPPENRKTPKTPPHDNVPSVTQSILKECHAMKNIEKAKNLK